MMRERIKSLELKNISQSFEGGSKLFEGLNLQLPLGKILAIEGNPGCGKSILLKIIAGLIEPTSGDVLYNGKSLNDQTFERFAPIRTSTAICFDNGGLLMNRTLLDNIKLPLLYNHQWRRERSQIYLDRLSKQFGIDEFLHLRPASASASVRKITGLIRSFLCTPQVLFFDDPSLGIGEAGTEALKYCIDNYRQEGKHDELIVIASSDSRFLSHFECDRMRIENKIVVPKIPEIPISHRGAA